MIPANRYRRVRRLLPGSALLTLALGAPPSGTELEAGGETGAYHYVGGCDGPHNYESYVAMQIRARHRTRDGWFVAGEGAGQLSRVTDSSASPSSSASEVGLRHQLFVLALRVGYEGETRHTWAGMLRVGLFLDAPAAPAVARPASEGTPPPAAPPPPLSPAVEQPEPVVTLDVEVADAGVALPGERDSSSR